MPDEPKYELKSVRTVRGTEARSIAKWEAQGWELVDQTPGKLQTTLNFRRARRTIPWVPIAALIGVAVLVLAIVGIVNLVQGDDEEAPADKPVAAASREPSATPDESPDEASTVEPSESPGTSTAAPSETPSDQPAASEETESTEPGPDATLTAKNSKAFAAVLKVSDPCVRSQKEFAAAHADRTVEFDGSIVTMANHGDYDTRFDILLAPGDKGPQSVVGPAFKYEDVGFYDLNVTGADSVRPGDLVHIVANVDRYNSRQCLFFLDPVATKAR